jgi:hypothetical protein
MDVTPVSPPRPTSARRRVRARHHLAVVQAEIRRMSQTAAQRRKTAA